jgi:quinol monooxygenase YgiN
MFIAVLAALNIFFAFPGNRVEAFLTCPGHRVILPNSKQHFVEKLSALSEGGSFNEAAPHHELVHEDVPDTYVTVHAFYKIKEEEEAEDVVEAIIEKCKRENGCLSVSWESIQPQGDGQKEMMLKAGFVDGSAVNEHYRDAGLLREYLREGPATLDLLELYGPDSELAVTHESTSLLEGVKVLTYSKSGKYEMKRERSPSND